MKISELSKISRVNPETIRMYRNLGLLHPKQNPNNLYYEYSSEDLMNLFLIRKLRGSSLSLDAISYTYLHSDLSDLTAQYQKELDHLDAEIKNLQQKKTLLGITLNHFKEYEQNLSGASEIEVSDDRIDACFGLRPDDPVLAVWAEKIEYFTQTLYIRKEDLEQDVLPQKIPVQVGIGSYRSIFEKEDLFLPEEYVVYPKGTYVASSVTLTDLHSIDREQIRPMLDYVRTHHYTIDSGTTAFLFRIQHTAKGDQFIYRLRMKVTAQFPPAGCTG